MNDANISYIKHYTNLDLNYLSKQDIYSLDLMILRNYINQQARSNHYKFMIYKTINPNLKPLTSALLNKSYAQSFIRLRVSSHYFPIETGRWTRTKREDRICTTCNVLGDEEHYIYECEEVNRNGLLNIPPMSELTNYEQLPTLLNKLNKFL